MKFTRTLNAHEVACACAEWLHRRGHKVVNPNLAFKAISDNSLPEPMNLTLSFEVEPVEPRLTASYDIKPKG